MIQRKDGQGHTSAFKRPGCPVAGQLVSGRVRQPRVVRGAPRHSEESLSGNGTDQEDPPISQDQTWQTHSGASEPNGQDHQAHLNTLPRKLSISQGNLQPTRLHIQKQIIINGFLQLSRRHCPSAFFSFLIESKVRDIAATAFRMTSGGEEGLVMDHGRPRSVFKLCRQEAGKQKQVGNAVISATTCGMRPQALQMGSSFQGARRRLGEGRGLDSRPQDSETAK